MNSFSVFLGSCLISLVLHGQPPPLTTLGEDGLLTLHPPSVPDELRNPVTPEYEAGFRLRSNDVLKRWTGGPTAWKKVDNRLIFESEKWSYPNAMLHVLAGNVDPGMAVLQAPDQPMNPGESDHTFGVDLYPAFTLKAQTRKYFQFGHLMSPEYRETFEKAISKWTRDHPAQVAHPLYRRFDPDAQGWGPNRFGHRQLDPRRTDNLYLMSAQAVYLFAEASGNEATRQKAKVELYGYFWAPYHIGQGEWDSTTYQPHNISPLLNLYDFAKDPEVRSAAKVVLDHFFTSAALKNHRNTFAGASKRDYSQTSQQGEGSMKFFGLYFPQAGAALREDHEQLFAIASGYRPPEAVLALARRDLELPVEILATKPLYENWKPGQSDRPGFFETLWLGRTVTAGSVVSAQPDGDILPLRITFNRGETGTNSLSINSQPKLNAKHAGDQIAQYANRMIWLRKAHNEPFTFQLAQPGTWQIRGERWFLDGGDTWFAIHPIQLGMPVVQPKSIQAKAASDTYVGFALELQEKGGPFANFDAFVHAVETKSTLQIDALETGRVLFQSSDGKTLEIQHNAENDIPTVTRDGFTRDWNNPEEWAVWRTMGRDSPVVDLGWKTGTLTVNAGGHHFESTFRIRNDSPQHLRREDLEAAKELTAESSFTSK